MDRILHSKRKTLLLTFCYFLFAAQSFSQTAILVKYYDASEQSFAIDTTGKLYFDADNLNVVITGNATPTSIPVSIIRRITFTSGVITAVMEVDGTTADAITLMPNPATSFLIIRNNSFRKMNVRIYSLAGQLLISGNYSSGDQVGIGMLKPGMYVVVINNKSYKLVKQ